MKKETWKEIGALLLFFLTVIFLFQSLWSFDPADLGSSRYPANAQPLNIWGEVGAVTAAWFLETFGTASYFIALLGGIWSGLIFCRVRVEGLWVKIGGGVVLVLSLSILDALCRWDWAQSPIPPWHGGVLGEYTARFLTSHFGQGGPFWIVAFVSLLSFILATDFLFYPFLSKLYASLRGRDLLAPLKGWWRREREESAPAPSGKESAVRMRKNSPAAESSAPLTKEERAVVREILEEEPAPPPPPKKSSTPRKSSPSVSGGDDGEEMIQPVFATSLNVRRKSSDVVVSPPSGGKYALPPEDLLIPPDNSRAHLDEGLIQERAQVLERALAQFRIEAKVVAIERGPAVTQYELSPAPGVKIQQITSLADDIALALRAAGVRIVAPIPGKSTVGVEVPNAKRAVVRQSELLPACGKDMVLPLFLGKDIAGKPLVADLAKMPHMLIAGTTGSGKTICINSILTGFLLKKMPRDLKLILIDPKMVEMNIYQDIPHLISPVVTDMKKAAGVLEWATREMDERYDLLARAGVRHIEQFNGLGKKDLRERLGEGDTDEVPEHLPYIVIVVDELADLMMVASGDVEASITRLAQKSRAVGIHILLATQRPSVDVITGLIKSNLPARISFQVASAIDSRTILDRKGAEKLLGSGDMLFQAPGSLKLVRAQGAFLTDDEVSAVVKYVKKQAKPEFDPGLDRWQKGEMDADAQDELYPEAVRLVLEHQRGSVSLLQRHFAVGYTRAARLIDMMAKEGLVGQYKGSQAREVLASLEDWEAAQGTRERQIKES